jgi:hypothetical protein
MLQARTNTQPAWFPTLAKPSFAEQMRATLVHFCQGCPHLQEDACTKLSEVLAAHEFGTPTPCPRADHDTQAPRR